jgi:TonB family protein
MDESPTTQEAIMVATAVQYGAIELKQSAQRFWFVGFIISLAIHSMVLSAFHLDLFHVGTDPRNIILHPVTLDPRIHTDPWIPGITTPPPTAGGRVRVQSERANPVPVQDEKADPAKSLATQEEMAQQVDPFVNGAGEGSGSGTGTIAMPGSGDDTPVPFEAVERLPEIITRVTPEYPSLAVRAGIEGRVIVKMLVGKDGHVREVAVVQSTVECLNDAALGAARGFFFTPAYMNNGPVTVWITVPFNFRLK